MIKGIELPALKKRGLKGSKECLRMKISKAMKTLNSIIHCKKGVNFFGLCFLAAFFFNPASAGFIEKREADKKVRELYERAIQSYYEGDFGRARLYWQQIVKIDKSQKRASRLAEQLAELVDEGESAEIEKMLRRAQEAYMKGDYGLALKICGQVRLIERAKDNPLALMYERELGELRNNIIKRDAQGLDNKDRLIRLTVNAYFDNRRDYACEYATYLKQKFTGSDAANALYQKISGAYPEEMPQVIILTSYNDLEKQYIGQGIDAFRRSGDAMVSREEHIRRAAEYYDKALKLEPSDMEVFILKGLIEVERRDFDAAIHLWRRALSLDKQRAVAKINSYIFEDDIIKRYFGLFTDTEDDIRKLNELRARTREIL